MCIRDRSSTEPHNWKFHVGIWQTTVLIMRARRAQVPCSMNICPNLTNHIIDLWRFHSRRILSLHDRRFMSQAGRTRYFAQSTTRARSARPGGERKISRSCRAPCEISRSPRLAHKVPVMQASEYFNTVIFVSNQSTTYLAFCNGF